MRDTAQVLVDCERRSLRASRDGASERNAHSRKVRRSFRDHRVRPLFLSTFDTIIPTYLLNTYLQTPSTANQPFDMATPKDTVPAPDTSENGKQIGISRALLRTK